MKYDKTWATIKFDPMLRKLNAAKEYLGSDYVLHPNYQPRIRHVDKDTNSDCRVLFDVQLKAKLAGRI